MDPRDRALQSNFPSLPVPKYGTLEPMSRHGERLLNASNGTFMEISRAWFTLIGLIGAYTADVPIPYGCIEESFALRCPAIPRALFDEFVDQAKAASPLETAAFIVWDERSGAFSLSSAKLSVQTPDAVEYEQPRLTRGEHMVMDLHSHGLHDAYFSPEDNADDRNNVKLVGVVGNCDRADPTSLFRVCWKASSFISISETSLWL